MNDTNCRTSGSGQQWQWASASLSEHMQAADHCHVFALWAAHCYRPAAASEAAARTQHPC